MEVRFADEAGDDPEGKSRQVEPGRPTIYIEERGWIGKRPIHYFIISTLIIFIPLNRDATDIVVTR